jgi:hypothetical protein
VIIDPRASRLAAACAVVLFISFAFALKDHKKEEKTYAVIFGTAYGPDDRPLYGVKVHIQPVGKKRPNWDLISDHRGEFAQRVPGPGDYEISGEAELAPVLQGKAQLSQKKRVRVSRTIHVERDVEQDISLHLR